jgi:acyl-CoA synthetase (AMP-forming)/AMP-acid ligase II
MNQLPHVGEAIALGAHLYPDKVAARDLARAMSFRQWNERSCRLANALLGLGLDPGDRVAILAYNCVEWLEIYAALAKAGLVAVPINFRLVASEVHYIAENAEAKAFIVQADLLDRVEAVRANLPIAAGRYVHFGGESTPAGYRAYEAIIAAAAAREPAVQILPDDPLALMYTSGTTGKPKGAIRTHGATALLSLVSEVELGLARPDTALLVMPMCHANSLFFAFAFAYCGAGCCVYDRKSFDPEHLLKTLAEEKCTFTSLVPTHYIMMLGLPDAAKRKYDVHRMSKLLISSAPARRETKLAIMEHFRNSSLFEMYGSTEAGWVTVLRPDEQLTKLGSIGRELAGSGRIRLLDERGAEVPDGQVGEIYSRTPYAFRGYWKLPEKTAEAFRGPYCTVGDMARRDADGYFHLVDRKKNMIISGGENVYPSEVESLLASYPKVKDVAVIGVPHEKWGEAVHAVIVLHDGQRGTEQEILDWCRDKIAGYKRPRSAVFVREEEMPRTATGKILHRALRERYARSPRDDTGEHP